MTQLLERGIEVRRDVDTAPVEEIVDYLEWLEANSGDGKDYECAKVQADAESAIERHTNNPAQAIVKSLEYLAPLYENRAETALLEDGSELTSWGTVDSSKLFLNNRYYRCVQPDGSVRYDVVTVQQGGRMAYRVTGDELTISFTPRKNVNALSPETYPHEVTDEAEITDAVRDLSDVAFAAAATTKVRSPKVQQAAHIRAANFFETTPIDRAIRKSESGREVARLLDTYHAR